MPIRRTKKATGSVALVGAGPGDPGLLTVHAQDVLATAETVVADASVPDASLRTVPDGAEVERLAPGADGLAAVQAAAKAGRTVVRLVTGDPFTSPAAVAEAEGYAKAKLTVEIVPGLPVLTTVPELAGVPLTAGGRPATLLDIAGEPDASRLPAPGGALAASCPRAEVGKLAAGLVERGWGGDTPLAVTRAGTTTGQATLVTTLDEADGALASWSERGEDGERVVAVAGPPVKLRDKLSWFETRPLFGWTVLVPRTREQAGDLSALLAGYGAAPLEVPTIAVEPPRTPAPMERAIKGLVSGRYQWVVFTSSNAVRAVRERLEEVGLDARAFAGVRLAAVGEATAAALASFGITVDLVPSGDQSSEGLLADFPPFDGVFDALDRVFLPRADIATETLVAGLKELGWAVDDITAYRTVRAAPPPAPIREALKTGGVDAVLFTSSSTVRNLLGIAGKPHEKTVIACIGPHTVATAQELGLRVDVTAPVASVPALAQALADHAAERLATLGPEAARPTRTVGRKRSK